MDIQTLKANLVAQSTSAEGNCGIWCGRAIRLLDSLDGTGVDLSLPDADLLKAMEELRDVNPKVASFLDSIPGLSSDRSHAEDHLSYLTMQYSSLLN
jgi:hypothetical protein